MKRSRYSVTFPNGEQRVILSYSPQLALDYYGVPGATVEKGDYRFKNRGGWTLDKQNLSEAMDFLGIKLPVKIKQTSHAGGQHGAHMLRADKRNGGLIHNITIKSWLKPDEAGRTLWHELCHAMQAERTAGETVAVPSLALAAWRFTDERKGAYRNRPIEVEARSYEAYNAELPLAR